MAYKCWILEGLRKSPSLKEWVTSYTENIHMLKCELRVVNSRHPIYYTSLECSSGTNSGRIFPNSTERIVSFMLSLSAKSYLLFYFYSSYYLFFGLGLHLAVLWLPPESVLRYHSWWYSCDARTHTALTVVWKTST